MENGRASGSLCDIVYRFAGSWHSFKCQMRRNQPGARTSLIKWHRHLLRTEYQTSTPLAYQTGTFAIVINTITIPNADPFARILISTQVAFLGTAYRLSWEKYDRRLLTSPLLCLSYTTCPSMTNVVSKTPRNFGVSSYPQN